MDLLFALRGLRRSPIFTTVAVGSLALGIGANTAIFSFVNAILLKQLPVPEPQRLVTASEDQGGNQINSVFSYPFIEELDKHATFFEGAFGRFPVRVNLSTQNSSEPLHGEVVTGDYFRTLRVKPALGRLLRQEDVAAAVANPVCVLNYSTWRERFASDPHIIGRTLLLNRHPYRVIGVTEPGFHGSQLQARFDMQLPVSRVGDFMGGFFASSKGGEMWRSAGFVWLEPIARLKPGITAEQAQAMIQPLARGIKLQIADPQNQKKVAGQNTAFRLSDGSRGANYDTSKHDPLLVLMGIAGLILLIACMNVANLLLARARGREKEFALRLSLGAGSWRLARQMMTESLAIGVCGGAIGLILSAWLMQALLFYFNGGAETGEGLQVRLDPVVLCFSAALSLVTALLFGLAPAWQSGKVDILSGLKGSSAARHAGVDSAPLRKVLVVMQLAFSVCLLFAAGLLTGTLGRLQTMDLGFKPAQVVALSMDPAMAGYQASQVDAVFDQVLDRLRAFPDVAAASYAVVSPLDGSMISLDIEFPSQLAKSATDAPVFNMVSPAYFATLKQPLLQGRDFSDHDRKSSTQVAIVNQLFVSQHMPGQNPLGRHFKMNGSDVEIVGVVRNARYQSLRETPLPTVYIPAAQSQSSGYTLLVRLRANTGRAVPEIKGTIRSVSAKMPIYNVRTLQAQIDSGISSERILSFLSELFGVLATLLCAIGLYGIIAYAVTSRTREIGIRFALGATRPGMAGMFFRESFLLLSAGVAIGVPLALISGRALKSLLFGLQPTDPATLGSVALILVIAGLAATLVPVFRAAQVQPSEALRSE